MRWALSRSTRHFIRAERVIEMCWRGTFRNRELSLITMRAGVRVKLGAKSNIEIIRKEITVGLVLEASFWEGICVCGVR
jgi:hypothetical protein